MGKVFVLLLIILLALASVAGYLFFTEKITVGEMQIADSQKQLEKGQSSLEEGNAKLEAGKGDLSKGKQEYEKAQRNLILVLLDMLFKGGKSSEEARKQIAEGDKQVTKGEGDVNTGEMQIDAGELELRRGMEKLRLAKDARIACALGAAFFVCLSIVLGFSWRRSLARIFVH
jgi:uncharacterized phage infection (PIP) family protein YhgE